MNSYHAVGVLLAGGASRRFGEPKALYKLNGKPFYQYSIEALKNTVEDIIIITQTQLIEPLRKQTPYEVLLDDEKYRGLGPLAGIYTAMKRVHSEWYILLPCDTPFIKEDVIKQLLSFIEKYPNKDAVIPIINGKNQPLIAGYHRRSLPTIEKHLSNNELKMGMLFEAVNTLFLDESQFDNLEAFHNINTKADMI
ncbi:molybdenum cofactor guanylyltransferase [Alkalihalobacillus sp. BA299]|uniref:molybdenum cofactor guanylyltransferase n=1 Tax=Alkalihalobacillus sp. BA299 TaxID=2815938 RepID=UPI001ADBE574|nr:molybdenum cofactor guanylyltransferase [Alkalihalobacillus sp. BA299]